MTNFSLWTKAFFESIDCKDKEFHVIQGGSHTTFPEGSFGPLIDWLRRNFLAQPEAQTAHSAA